MRALLRVKRWKAAAIVATLAVVVAVPAIAASMGEAKSEHWGVIYRNTIGSPVAQLRDGPYGTYGVTGDAATPPYGKGSLGIEVANGSEKIDFGNEVDFTGQPVLGITATGFSVFQTGENTGGNPASRNMPNIRFEIDPNLTNSTSHYSTMVWVPDAAPVVNQWSGYIDATTTGDWYLTGSAGTATSCNQATMCSFTTIMQRLDDGGDAPVILSVAVGKGRDNAWAGAIDGFRLNSKIYDFERDGVHAKDAPH